MIDVKSARYSSDYLLSQIAKISSKASPNEPNSVTQRKFDDTREQLNIPCPRAARLVTRFKRPWKELLLAANQPGAFQSLRRAEQGSRDQVPFDQETAIASVKSAANSLGLETLRPEQYAAFRRQLLEGSKGLNRQRLEARWTTPALIQAVGWENVLEAAGLQRTDVDPFKALDNPDAMGLYLECRGSVPPVRVAIEFLRSHGVSAMRRSMTTEEALEILRARRQRGPDGDSKWTPSRALHKRERPDVPDACRSLEKEKLALLKPARKVLPSGWWKNEANVLEGLKNAIQKLDPGESLTQVSLRRLAKENRGQIPTPSNVTEFARRNGTNLAELRERARRELSET